MESIVDKSAILRTFARVALMGVVVGLSGCSPHDVQEDKFIIYLDYGTPKDRTGVIYDYYTGISIGSPEDIIVAAADGTVDYIASSANQELIIIYHGRDEEGLHMRTEYWYHSGVLVNQGDSVTRGQAIGILGGQRPRRLYFRVAKAPENLYGISSAWIPENPHDYWIGSSGKATCFRSGESYSQKSSLKLTWPLEC